MRCSHRFLRALLGAAIAGCFLASIPLATAAVYSPRQALPAQTVQQFLANPAALLAQYPNGGPQMIAQVRDLAASDPATLSALIGLLASANTDQATAIGIGLGQVAQMAVSTDQAYATQIQDAVVTAQNNSALVAFSAVIGGDIKLSAATGGVGGGVGGGGGEAPTGPNAPFGVYSSGIPPNFPTFTITTPDNFFTSSFTPGSPVSRSR